MKKSFVSTTVLTAIAIAVVAAYMAPTVAHARAIVIDLQDLVGYEWQLYDGNGGDLTRSAGDVRGKITITKDSEGQITKIRLNLHADGVPNGTGGEVVWDSSHNPDNDPLFSLELDEVLHEWETYNWQMTISPDGELTLHAIFTEAIVTVIDIEDLIYYTWWFYDGNGGHLGFRHDFYGEWYICESPPLLWLPYTTGVMTGEIVVTQDSEGIVTEVKLSLYADGGVPNNTGAKVKWDPSNLPDGLSGYPYDVYELWLEIGGIWHQWETHKWQVTISPDGELTAKAKFTDEDLVTLP